MRSEADGGGEANRQSPLLLLLLRFSLSQGRLFLFRSSTAGRSREQRERRHPPPCARAGKREEERKESSLSEEKRKSKKRWRQKKKKLSKFDDIILDLVLLIAVPRIWPSFAPLASGFFLILSRFVPRRKDGYKGSNGYAEQRHRTRASFPVNSVDVEAATSSSRP